MWTVRVCVFARLSCSIEHLLSLMRGAQPVKVFCMFQRHIPYQEYALMFETGCLDQLMRRESTRQMPVCRWARIQRLWHCQQASRFIQLDTVDSCGSVEGTRFFPCTAVWATAQTMPPVIVSDSPSCSPTRLKRNMCLACQRVDWALHVSVQ